MSASGPFRIEIGDVAITGRSGVEARRLADALPAAIERALATLGAGAPLPRPRGAAAHAGQAIARRIVAAREAQG